MFAPGLPPLKASRTRPEDALQVMIWTALRLVLAPTVVCWSNENRRNGRIEGSLRRSRGVVAGVPDMVFHWRGGIAYVELKAPRNGVSGPGRAPSDGQLRVHTRLRAIGVPVATCTSLDQVLAFLRDCGCPLRATLP